MNLIAVPFSLPVVVVRAQPLASRVRIEWVIRILARFGRTGPVPRVSGPDHFDIRFRICTKSWVIWGCSGSVRVVSGRATNRFWFPGRAGPVQGSGIPDRSGGPEFRAGP